jgi:hypothetical protein
MTNLDTPCIRPPSGPHRPLRDDPKYDEIKKMIEDFPRERLEELKRYIQRWLRES